MEHLTRQPLALVWIANLLKGCPVSVSLRFNATARVHVCIRSREQPFKQAVLIFRQFAPYFQCAEFANSCLQIAHLTPPCFTDVP